MRELPEIKPRRAGEVKLSPGDARDARSARAREMGEIPPWGLKQWIWFIIKNIIGFAIITFPGKRHLTARVIRGTPVKRTSASFRSTIAAIAIILPALILIYLRFVAIKEVFTVMDRRRLVQMLLYICSVATLWIFGLRSDRAINWVFRRAPRIRRK